MAQVESQVVPSRLGHWPRSFGCVATRAARVLVCATSSGRIGRSFEGRDRGARSVMVKPSALRIGPLAGGSESQPSRLAGEVRTRQAVAEPGIRAVMDCFE